MATTLNDYLVDVIYREVYNTQKFVKSLQVGVHDLRDVANLLQICTWYQEFLEFYIDNDESFTVEEVQEVMAHLDDILWTNYATVELS